MTKVGNKKALMQKKQKAEQASGGTEDAIVSVLEKAKNYTVFKKKASTMANEYTESLSKILEEMAMQEDEKENLFIKEKVSKKESKQVVLSSWAIKLVESAEGTLDAIVFGVIKGTSDVVQSSFLMERKSLRCVKSKNTTYFLEGALDRSVKLHPGFREETAEMFKDGFPENWKSIVREEFMHIKKEKARNATAAQEEAGNAGATQEEAGNATAAQEEAGNATAAQEEAETKEAEKKKAEPKKKTTGIRKRKKN